MTSSRLFRSLQSTGRRGRTPRRRRVRDTLPTRRLRLEALEDRRLLSAAPGNEAIELFSISPALFVENQGQWADESVRFVHQGDGANVAMTDTGPVFQLFRSEPKQEAEARREFQQLAAIEEARWLGSSAASPQGPSLEPAPDSPGDSLRSATSHPDDLSLPEDLETEVLEFSAGFVGANTVTPIGLDQAETTFNYFIGDESNWASDVASYETVAYENLYDGIDLHTWGQRNSLKYEFHVAPGADFGQIQIHYEGIEGLEVDSDGALHVDLGAGWDELIDDVPYIYQVIDDQQIEVAGRFAVLDDFSYTFELTGPYDASLPLVIDPDLSWSTYLGGSDWDRGYGIAVDAAGNALVTGGTVSSGWVFDGFDTIYNGNQDAFVAKISATGGHLWSTYLGGSEEDRGWDIAVDAAGNALVTGKTSSLDFAGANNSHQGIQDGFVAKVTAGGSLAWATYLGGSGTDFGSGIVVDAAGNALVTGFTTSSNFEGANNTRHQGQDAFVAKVTPGGFLAWATYLGGESGASIAVDSAGNALVTGWTSSSGFEEANNTHHGFYLDAFVAKVTPGGSLTWATYLGGSGTEYGLGIAVDAAGNALVTGITTSSNFDGANNTHPGGYENPFVAKVTAGGSLAWATYLGGNLAGGNGEGIAVDGVGNALVTGVTHSNVFVAKVTPGGSMAWATYLGGSGVDHGQGIAVDAAGNILLTGNTSSTDFAMPGGFDTSYNGGNYDAFVAKLYPAAREDALFEVLSKYIAYQDCTEGARVDSILGVGPAAAGNFVINKVFEGATGFYAVGLTEPGERDPILAIRGTEPTVFVTDVFTGFDPEGVGWGQYLENRTNVETWLAEVSVGGARPSIVGHSLGGALAQWFAADYTQQGHTMGQVVTFNSPGISRDYADNRFQPDLATRVMHYIVNGDVVSMAGEAFVPGEVQMASFSDPLWMWDFDKHLLPLLNSSIGARNWPGDVSWESLSVDTLSDPWFAYDDPDYDRWLIQMQVALISLAPASPLTAVPAMLVHRVTTEAARRTTGAATHQVVRAFEQAWDVAQWTAETAETFVLTLGERAHDLYEAMRITVDKDFSLTVDEGDPPMLRLDGGLSIDLGDAMDIDLPAWLGGSFTADHLIELAEMDFGGVMDRDHLTVSGQLGLLGDLVTVDGTAQLDWAQAELTVAGAMDVLNGFVTASGSVQVGAGLDLVIRSGAAVRIPDGVPLIGGKQIASGQFLLNYVNNLSMADDFVAGWGPIWTPFGDLVLGLQVWLDGDWNILGATEIDALEQGKGTDGQSFEVAPGVDWVLLAAQWENASTTADLTLETPSGLVLTEAAILADPSMAIVDELTDDHQTVVRVDNPEAGGWTVVVTDPADLGAVEITAYRHDSAPAVSVVGVGDGLAREPVQIDLEAFDADSDAQISLFYDRDAEGFDGVMIAQGIAETDGPAQYVWETTGVAAGDYYVYAMILDGQNPPVMAYSDSTLRITDHAVVLGRHVFYNNSGFDGNNSDGDEQDDTAIATNKAALLPDRTATFANYTNYEKGINGIMVDIAGLADPGNLSAADFGFKVGNGSGWEDGPEPLPIAVREGAGVDGSDRVTIRWDANAIKNQWLQVTVRATEKTGLPKDDVFYFGNAPGEAGDNPINTIVNATDEIVARNFQHSAVDEALVDDKYDYNRDGLVNGTDQIIARENQTNPLTMLRLITMPVRDAKLKVSEPTTLSADLDWVYEFEQMNSKNSRQKRSSVERAVDLLLAAEAV